MSIFSYLKEKFCIHDWSSKKVVNVNSTQKFVHVVCKKCGTVKAVGLINK